MTEIGMMGVEGETLKVECKRAKHKKKKRHVPVSRCCSLLLRLRGFGASNNGVLAKHAQALNDSLVFVFLVFRHEHDQSRYLLVLYGLDTLRFRAAGQVLCRDIQLFDPVFVVGALKVHGARVDKHLDGLRTRISRARELHMGNPHGQVEPDCDEQLLVCVAPKDLFLIVARRGVQRV